MKFILTSILFLTMMLSTGVGQITLLTQAQVSQQYVAPSGGGGSGTVALDTTSTTNALASDQTITWTHTVGAGLTNSYLVVQGVAGFNSGVTPTISCLVDGISIPSIVGPTYPNNSSADGIGYTFGLTNISAGAHTIVLAYTISSGTSQSFLGFAASYQHVSQSAPVGHTAPNFGSSASIAATITSSTQDRVISFAAGGSDFNAWQVTKTQANNFNLFSGAGNAAQADTDGSSTVNLSWTMTGSDYWFVQAVDLAHD
jgi:hypothetical protein